jgi:hypothetical protein
MTSDNLFSKSAHTLKFAPFYFLLLQLPQGAIDGVSTFLTVDNKSFLEKAGIVAVQLLFSAYISAFSFLSVNETLENKKPRFFGIWKKIQPRFLALTGAALVVGILCAMGFMAMIVPGFILVTLYFFTPYFLLSEDIPVFIAMRRSFLLSKKFFVGSFFRVCFFGLLHFGSVSFWDFFIGRILHDTGEIGPEVLYFLVPKIFCTMVFGVLSEVYMAHYFYRIKGSP